MKKAFTKRKWIPVVRTHFAVKRKKIFKMRKLFFILAVLTIGSRAIAQEVDKKDIPSSVKKIYDSIYPKAGNTSWKMKNGNYEATSGKDKEEISVLLDKDGKLVETRSVIDIAVLPQPISAYVIKNYPGAKISKACSVVSADGKMTYLAEVGEVSLMFDAKGNFIKSEMMPKEDDHDMDKEKDIGTAD
jgi:hypothetical protein